MAVVVGMMYIPRMPMAKNTQNFSKLLLGNILRSYPPEFGAKLVDIFPDLISDKAGMPPLPKEVPTAEDTFRSLSFDDVWTEADMVSVCHYLRSGCHLQIPPSFRELIPEKL